MRQICCLLAYLIFACLAFPVAAQLRPSATPVSAVLSRPSTERPQVVAPTVTPPPVPTPLPAARLQALETAGDINVRPVPDIDSDVLGTISYGTEYPVLRSYYRWYELRYELSPNGRAWVYGDLVALAGDTSQIEVLDNLSLAEIGQAESSFVVGTSASEEDGADSRTIEIDSLPAEESREVEAVALTPLPTFTAPAATPGVFTDQLAIEETNSLPLPDLPPILPILALGGLGAIGMLIALIRG